LRWNVSSPKTNPRNETPHLPPLRRHPVRELQTPGPLAAALQSGAQGGSDENYNRRNKQFLPVVVAGSANKAHKMKTIDHKAIAADIVTAINNHKLTNDEATKVLIYTATKLISQRFKCPDAEAAEMLSKAALYFRDTIKQVDRLFQNQG
jgi:hypothetical protein